MKIRFFNIILLVLILGTVKASEKEILTDIESIQNIAEFKEKIINDNKKRALFLSYIKKPYYRRSFSLFNPFSIDMNIGAFTFDPQKGYKMPGEYGHEKPEFFSNRSATNKISTLFGTISLTRNIDEFINLFSTKDASDFYEKTFFFQYILEHCWGQSFRISDQTYKILEKKLFSKYLLQLGSYLFSFSSLYLAYKTIKHCMENYTEPFFDNLKNNKTFNQLTLTIKPSKEKGFEKIILSSEIKDFFQNYEKIIFSPHRKENKHLIFVGPAGTGKTTTAVLFATEKLKKKTIIVNSGMLKSCKNPAGALKSIFENNKNNVIIFDEIESLISDPDLKHALLTYLQSGGTNTSSPIVFATTNIINIKDEFKSLTREGRFNPVFIGGLAKNEISEFIEKIITSRNLSLDENLKAKIYEAFADGTTGARITNIFDCAISLSNQKITSSPERFSRLKEKMLDLFKRQNKAKEPLFIDEKNFFEALKFFDMNRR